MSTDSAPTTPPVAMTVHAELNGWPVDLAFTMPPSALGKALARLAELGYRPRVTTAPATPATAARPSADQGGPCCPLHGTAKVREGKHGPFCAAKLPDGTYCKERPI